MTWLLEIFWSPAIRYAKYAARKSCYTQAHSYTPAVIQISDFGMSRNMTEDYYVSKAGGKIPVKWTAPEV